MSLLVRYTLSDANDHDNQIAAMRALVDGLMAAGIDGLNYTCFATEDPTQFIGILQFPDDATFKAFQASEAFAAYRDRVGPTFANPPQTSPITEIASTLG